MVFLLFGGCGDHWVDEMDSRRYGGLAAEVQTPKSYKVIKLKRVQNWIGGIGIVAVYDERDLWEGWSEGPKPWQFLVNIQQQRAVF